MIRLVISLGQPHYSSILSGHLQFRGWGAVSLSVPCTEISIFSSELTMAVSKAEWLWSYFLLYF